MGSSLPPRWEEDCLCKDSDRWLSGDPNGTPVMNAPVSLCSPSWAQGGPLGPDSFAVGSRGLMEPSRRDRSEAAACGVLPSGQSTLPPVLAPLTSPLANSVVTTTLEIPCSVWRRGCQPGPLRRASRRSGYWFQELCFPSLSHGHPGGPLLLQLSQP